MIPIVTVFMPGVLSAPVVIVIMIIMPSLIVNDLNSHSPAVDVRVTAGVKSRKACDQNEIKTENYFFHPNPPQI
jgi:hypothetical protein